MEPSAAYRGAVLTRIDASTGQVLHSSSMPGSVQGAAFAGVGVNGFHVIGRGSSNKVTVASFSSRGELQWSHLLTVVFSPANFSIRTQQEASPQVFEVGGRAFVSLAEIGGGGAFGR